MNILLTNDDGVFADGIRALAEVLSEKHNVLVVAPMYEKSSCSHALTTYKPQTLAKYHMADGITAYSFDGTPADCVKFAVHVLTDFKIDVVISGINRGNNIGTDILYSGTVSGAREATFLGYKGIALSSVAFENNNYIDCAKYVLNNMDKLMALDFDGTCWNINFPNVPYEQFKDAMFCKMGIQTYSDGYRLISSNVEDEHAHLIPSEYERMTLEHKLSYALEGDLYHNDLNDEWTDVELLKKGFITITPLSVNITNTKLFERLKGEKL